MGKTMIDTYQELVADDYDTWSTTGKGKDKIKKTGANGTYTAYDEKENRAMYDAYVAEINAQNAKNAALEANVAARANTMRENAILTERAREYAEYRAKMNGTASAGVSQTAMVDLYAKMAGARADAQASYDDQNRSIIQDYQDAIYEAQRDANAIAAEAGVQRAERADLIRENRVTDVEDALADYDVGNISFDELTRIYDDNKSSLDSEENKGIIGEYQAILKQQDKEDGFFNRTAETNDKGTDEDLLASDLKVTEDSHAIGLKQISLESINALLDVDGAGDGDEQDEWVNEVINKIKRGNIKNGTIIDMNYGVIGGQNKGNYFVYQDGKLYQSDWTYDEIDKLLSETVQPLVEKYKAAHGRIDPEDILKIKSTTASNNGEFKIKVNGKEVTFLRKDD